MRKKALWAVGIVVVIAVVAVVAGPWVYKNWIVGDADAELALPSQTSAATVDVNGTWTVVPGPESEDQRTQAGYRVDEVLRGENITVNGRTQQVSGTVEVAGNRLMQGTVTVDLSSVPPSGAPATVRAVGTMEIKGRTQPVTTDLLVARSGGAVIVQGAVPVRWSDYGVEAPRIGDFVQVEDTGTIEFLANLARR